MVGDEVDVNVVGQVVVSSEVAQQEPPGWGLRYQCNGVVAFKVIQRRAKFLELNHKANERTKSRFSAPSLGLEFPHLFLRCKKSVEHMNVHTSSYPNNHLGALHASYILGYLQNFSSDFLSFKALRSFAS